MPEQKKPDYDFLSQLLGALTGGAAVVAGYLFLWDKGVFGNSTNSRLDETLDDVTIRMPVREYFEPSDSLSSGYRLYKLILPSGKEDVVITNAGDTAYRHAVIHAKWNIIDDGEEFTDDEVLRYIYDELEGFGYEIYRPTMTIGGFDEMVAYIPDVYDY